MTYCFTSCSVVHDVCGVAPEMNPDIGYGNQIYSLKWIWSSTKLDSTAKLSNTYLFSCISVENCISYSTHVQQINQGRRKYKIYFISIFQLRFARPRLKNSWSSSLRWAESKYWGTQNPWARAAWHLKACVFSERWNRCSFFGEWSNNQIFWSVESHNYLQYSVFLNSFGSFFKLFTFEERPKRIQEREKLFSTSKIRGPRLDYYSWFPGMR